MNKRFKRLEEIERSIRDMADTLQKEKRTRTEEETASYAELIREKEYLTMQLHADDIHFQRPEREETLRDVIRAKTEEMGKKYQLIVRADNPHKTEDLAKGGLVPLTVGDIIKPLYEGLILSKVGIQLPTGLTGEYEWPVAEAVKAAIAGEGVRQDATKIDMSKVAAVRDRLAVGAEYTYESLFSSAGKIDSLVKETLPMAVADLINQVMFSTEKVNATAKICGPLVGLEAVSLGADETKWFRLLMQAKAGILGKGYSSDGLCFVMSESTKAILESTPKDKGSGIMLIENDSLCGVPVFCTHHIGEGKIALGNWKYQVCGMFGDVRLIVDPYTGADGNMIRVWLNVNYGTATLRPDAFTLLELGA